MKLIKTDAQLRSHIPHIIASVKGETPFIERLTLFLDLAEDWVKTTFTGESTFNTICGYTDSNPLKITTSRLVVAEALRRAIPSLDIVLTPNGFGVVNTSFFFDAVALLFCIVSAAISSFLVNFADK